MLIPIPSKPVDLLKTGACRRWREYRPAVEVSLCSEDAVDHLLVVGTIFKFAPNGLYLQRGSANEYAFSRRGRTTSPCNVTKANLEIS